MSKNREQEENVFDTEEAIFIKTQFIKEFDDESLVNKYIKPLTPILIIILSLWFASNEKWAKLDLEQYATMFFSILLPIVVTDFASGKISITKIIQKMKAIRKNPQIPIKPLLLYNDVVTKFINHISDGDFTLRYENSAWLYVANYNETGRADRSGNTTTIKLNSHGIYENLIYYLELPDNIILWLYWDGSHNKELYVVTRCAEKLCEYINKNVLTNSKKKDISHIIKIRRTDKAAYIETVQKNFISADLNRLIISNDNKNKLISEITLHMDPIRSSKKYLISRKNKMNILLYGSPGTGKTTLAMAIANYMKRDVFFVNKENPDEFFSNISTLSLPNTVVVFDDIDFWNMKCRNENINISSTNNQSILNTVSSNVQSNEKKNDVGLFSLLESKQVEQKGIGNALLMKMMTLLDGYDISDDSVFVFTTNNLDAFDDAVFRQGRITLKLHVDEMNTIEQYDVLTNNIYNKKLSDDLSQDTIRKLLDKKKPLSYVSNEIIVNNLESYDIYLNELRKLAESD
jgi:SpoVK/Ycf46/Vps4 family AAA+-type ATPase